jgi:hypothetical protein
MVIRGLPLSTTMSLSRCKSLNAMSLCVVPQMDVDVVVEEEAEKGPESGQTAGGVDESGPDETANLMASSLPTKMMPVRDAKDKLVAAELPRAVQAVRRLAREARIPMPAEADIRAALRGGGGGGGQRQGGATGVLRRMLEQGEDDLGKRFEGKKKAQTGPTGRGVGLGAVMIGYVVNGQISLVRMEGGGAAHIAEDLARLLAEAQRLEERSLPSRRYSSEVDWARVVEESPTLCHERLRVHLRLCADGHRRRGA